LKVINRNRILISLLVFALAIVYLLYWPKELRLFCPFHAVTGFWCPGCGGTRAAEALLNLDFQTAFRMNSLLMISPLLAGLGIYLDKKKSNLVIPYLVLVAILVLLFTVLRNIPGSGLDPS